MNNNQSSKKIIQWIAGLTFLIAAIASIFSSNFFTAISWLIVGLICIPPSLKFIQDKIQFQIPTLFKYIIVISLWFLGAILIPKNKESYNDISKKETDSVAKKQALIDSINMVKIALEEHKKELIWESTTVAGRIYKTHNDWTKDDCEKVAKNLIWIGMSLDMLKYERGNPTSANPSNYGNGVRWQWCWDGYTPSCFYGEENGIITAYN